MALSITLTSVAPALTYRLQAEDFVIMYERAPVQAPLPGADPLLIDLGQFRPRVRVTGTLRAVVGDDGGNIIPSQNNLEDFVTDVYNTTITLTVVVGGVTNNYIGKIASCTFDLKSAREDLWGYTLALLTQGRS